MFQFVIRGCRRLLVKRALMIDHRPGGRILRGWATTPRGNGVSLIKNRFRYATRSDGAPYTFAILHQMIILLEIVKDLADLISLRVKTTHHLALLCQFMLTLLQGKYVQKRRIYVEFTPKSSPKRKDTGEIKIPTIVSSSIKKAPKYG